MFYTFFYIDVTVRSHVTVRSYMRFAGRFIKIILKYFAFLCRNLASDCMRMRFVNFLTPDMASKTISDMT